MTSLNKTHMHGGPEIMLSGDVFVLRVLIIIVSIIASDIVHASTEEGKRLFEQKCDQCHTLDRPLSKHKTLEEWKRTTQRMSGYSKGAISGEEAGIIAEYLFTIRGPEKEESPEEPEENDPGKSMEHELFDFKKVEVEQFIEPSLCGECHSEIYRQWRGSMHSKAYIDPLWRAAAKFFSKEATGAEETLEMKACIKCHTPLGFRSSSIVSPAEDFDRLAELPSQGIFCNWCHNISRVKHIGDAEYEVEPGGGEDDPSTMLGPHSNSESDFHPTQYSELHTKSEFCGLCHNVSHAANKLPLEQTYDEWKGSPYNTGNPDTAVYCQDCHMRQRPGVPATGKTPRPDNPGRAADNGPLREHVSTHYFVGGNSIVTKLLGSDLHSRMAVDRLQNAADMEIIKIRPYIKGSVATVKVKVINSGAGHYLPTGITEIRQMWLDVEIKDAGGKTVFRSGALDDKGILDSEAVLYYTQLGNRKGDPVINVALADRILYDHRVPPKGYVTERYMFHIPTDAASPLKIKASLKYRSISQDLAKTLIGEDAPEIPVVEMVSVESVIEPVHSP